MLTVDEQHAYQQVVQTLQTRGRRRRAQRPEKRTKSLPP
jgi:hypothetical protein